MRLLITGASGQVGNALAALARLHGLDPILATRPGFDLATPETIDAAVAASDPTHIVNAAAYTAVDRAESEPEAAFAANATGPARLAALAHSRGAKFLHISTDYVFDGTKPTPYDESDPPSPTGAYGASKRAGETAVQTACPGAVILRTAWVYAPTGKNFLRTMLTAAAAGKALRVVADQHGCPTLASDLAAAILRLVLAPAWHPGLYHATGGGQTSWHGFAAAIFDRAAAHGWPRPHLTAIATADWPTPASRPLNSRLSNRLFDSTFGFTLPSWTNSLPPVVDAVLCRMTPPTGAP